VKSKRPQPGIPRAFFLKPAAQIERRTYDFIVCFLDVLAMRLRPLLVLLVLSLNVEAKSQPSQANSESRTTGTILGMQQVFYLTADNIPSIAPDISGGDPAGRPNSHTRLEVTSPINSTLYCAKKGDRHKSGYAHFTNALGKENKHMFWTWVTHFMNKLIQLRVRQAVRSEERLREHARHPALWRWSR
jgi:hypothetical protein